MTRPGPDIEIAEGAVSGPARRSDTAIRAAAGVTVGALAGIAGAISYSHMRELAAAHGEAGWQAHTFPLSVDGIEIVASLVLLADRRTGRSSGWLPWAALAAGTTASLAANIAAAGADLVGRVVAGWPAFALLVAVKLMSQLLEPRRHIDRPAIGDDRPVPADDRPAVTYAGGDDQGTAAGPLPRSTGTATNGRRVGSLPTRTDGLPNLASRNGRIPHPGTGTGTAHAAGTRTRRRDGARRFKQPKPGTGTAAQMETGTASDIAVLMSAARVARDRLLERGDSLTRDSLAAELRREGHPVRNARVSYLLTALKREYGAQPDDADLILGSSR